MKLIEQGLQASRSISALLWMHLNDTLTHRAFIPEGEGGGTRYKSCLYL